MKFKKRQTSPIASAFPTCPVYVVTIFDNPFHAMLCPRMSLEYLALCDCHRLPVPAAVSFGKTNGATILHWGIPVLSQISAMTKETKMKIIT
jgi:hypothetical protein